jgi:NADP-dependent 3-hydroxy acid dehydrogenase YdfG
VSQTLSAKTAIISRSCSSIGEAIALELSSIGFDVVINYPFPSLKPLAVSLSNSLPAWAITVCADISTIEGPRVMVNEAVKQFGKIGIVVNNAAIAINLPLEEQTLDHSNSLVNLMGEAPSHISCPSPSLENRFKNSQYR